MRTPIPDPVAVEILFTQDHTCCVCNERGKQVQIHHIDENPSNHLLENLAVLCFDCHDRTQQKGGFGRKLSANEVRRYRDDWLHRIVQRRIWADEIAAAKRGGGEPPLPDITSSEWRRPPELLLRGYIRGLPEVRRDAYQSAEKLWSSPNTTDMTQGCYLVTDVIEQAWCHLASWFPPNHFGSLPAKKYVNEYLASRYSWHRAIAEPSGHGSGGTIVRIDSAHGVMTDAEDMLVATVRSLFNLEDGFSEWLAKWSEAASKCSPD